MENNYKNAFWHCGFLKAIRFCLPVLMMVVVLACDIKENKVEPTSSFKKIYDDRNFQSSFDPLDIKQTPDSGFLILSSRDKWSITLLKTDKQGQVIKLFNLPSPYGNALPNLMQIGESFYFFCMNELSLFTCLMKVNEDTWEAELERQYSDILYPLAVSQVPEGAMLLQSYNRDSRNTQLTKISPDFNISWRASYPILEDKEEPIISHLTRIGQRLPFLTGFTGEDLKASNYYFNGYHNFTFSMVFVSPTNGEVRGVVNGFQDKSAVSGAALINGNKMALSRYSYGDNFIMPFSELNPNAVNFSGDLNGIQLPELSLNAPVFIQKLKVTHNEVLFFASDTKSNQIVLYSYDLKGNLLGTKYWGSNFPYKIASFTSTTDGGLAILGKSYVAGKFPRIVLIKLSAQEVSDLANG